MRVANIVEQAQGEIVYVRLSLPMRMSVSIAMSARCIAMGAISIAGNSVEGNRKRESDQENKVK